MTKLARKSKGRFVFEAVGTVLIGYKVIKDFFCFWRIDSDDNDRVYS